AFAPQRPGHCTDEQARSLPQQVIVRRRMPRPMAPDEMTMPVDRLQPAIAKRTSRFSLKDDRAFAAEKKPGERAVHQSDGMLETRTPIDPSWIRALAEPRIEQCPAAKRITLFPRKVICLRERHQLVMSVQLPKVLDVPHQRGVAVVELLTEHQ